MSIADLLPFLGENREKLVASLLDGSYQPQTVRVVEIAKPGGGNGQRGIPHHSRQLLVQASR
jgi:RNA-directed DNA polymerase